MNDSTRGARRPWRALLPISANPGRHPRHGRRTTAHSGVRRQPIIHRFGPLIEGAISWRAARLGALVLGLLLVVGAAAASAHRTAGCGRNRIGVRGPTANALNTSFNETVFGCATGRANYVISAEQRSPAGGCASTYRAEVRRSDFSQWPTGTGRVRGRFSLVANFDAHNPGTHGICSYLVNRTTKQTYAHAGRFWTNS